MNEGLKGFIPEPSEFQKQEEENKQQKQASFLKRLRLTGTAIAIAAAGATAGFFGGEQHQKSADEAVNNFDPVLIEATQDVDGTPSTSSERWSEEDPFGYLDAEGKVEAKQLEKNLTWAISEYSPADTLEEKLPKTFSFSTIQDQEAVNKNTIMKERMSKDFSNWIIQNHPEDIETILNQGIGGSKATDLAMEYEELTNTENSKLYDQVPLTPEEIVIIKKGLRDGNDIVKKHSLPKDADLPEVSE